MTLETKKRVAIALSALAGVVAIAGIVLMATQIKTEGSVFFVSYLLYTLAILAGGMFITWIPTMHNYGWKMALQNGKPTMQKKNSEVDRRRSRLVIIPIATLFFELYGFFSYCYDIWQRPLYNYLRIVTVILTVISFVSLLVVIMAEDIRERKKNM